MPNDNNFNLRLEETARDLERIIDAATRWSGESESVSISIRGVELSEDDRATLLGFARLKSLTLEQLQFVQIGILDLIQAKYEEAAALRVHLGKVAVVISGKIQAAQDSSSKTK